MNWDPHEKWMSNNSNYLEDYLGKVVAIHPTLGVVASGTSIREATEKARESGHLDEVVLFHISNTARVGGI